MNDQEHRVYVEDLMAMYQLVDRIGISKMASLIDLLHKLSGAGITNQAAVYTLEPLPIFVGNNDKVGEFYVHQKEFRF